MPQGGRNVIAVAAQDVVKTYGSKKYGIRGLSFEVLIGEKVCFYGPNGSGKSTLLKALAGAHRIDSGKIEICGIDIAIQPELAKSTLSFIPDSNASFARLTTREYLEFISIFHSIKRDRARPKIDSALSILGLAEKKNSFIDDLSQGQRKKVDIAATLIVEPKIIIADELFSGLDQATIAIVIALYSAMTKAGKSIVFSTHDQALANEFSGRIVFLKDGEIDEETTSQYQLSLVLASMSTARKHSGCI